MIDLGSVIYKGCYSKEVHKSCSECILKETYLCLKFRQYNKSKILTVYEPRKIERI
jgi:hypothetical protein